MIAGQIVLDGLRWARRDGIVRTPGGDLKVVELVFTNANPTDPVEVVVRLTAEGFEDYRRSLVGGVVVATPEALRDELGRVNGHGG